MVYLLRKNIKTKQSSDKLNQIKLEPFRIQKKLGPVIFRLKLLQHIRIYPVFHISLLEKVSENAKREPIHIDKETQKLLYKVD